MTKAITQIGGGNCSLCGAPGVTKVTCPANKQASKPNPAKHNTVAKVNSNTLALMPKVPSPKSGSEDKDVYVGVANIVDGTNVIFDFTMISKNPTKVRSSIAPWKEQYGDKLKNFYVVRTKMNTNYITHGIVNEQLVHQE